MNLTLTIRSFKQIRQYSCNYHNSEQEISDRFIDFLKEADRAVEQLPHRQFHLTINRALLGVYLADPKVNNQKNVKTIARKILLSCGGSAFFFLCNWSNYGSNSVSLENVI